MLSPTIPLPFHVNGLGVFLEPDPAIITAVIIVQIVDERPLDAVTKGHAGDAHPPRHRGRSLFNDHPDAPLGIPEVNYLITQFQEKSLHRTGPASTLIWAFHPSLKIG
jgi:hypothetical protein